MLNLLKTNTTGKVQFDFKHALAKLNVQIDAFVDGIEANVLADKTKIYVRKVTFEGFVTQGSFNLNAKAANPAWYDMAGSSYINGGSVTIYDGRTDGREAVSPADSEQPQGLNSTIIQDEKYYTTYPTTPNGSVKTGVTNTAVNLFTEPGTGTTEEKKASPIYVIPSGQPLKVTIVYDVETDTEELPTYLSDGETHGTSVQNTITKTIKTSGSEDIKLTAGKQYTIKLHLGMNSVKFDATVSSWATPAVEGSADLPANVTSAP